MNGVYKCILLHFLLLMLISVLFFEGDDESKTSIGWFDESNRRVQSFDQISKTVIRSTLRLKNCGKTRQFTCRIEAPWFETWEQVVTIR